MSCTTNDFLTTAQNTVWPVFVQAYPPGSYDLINTYPPNGLLWMLNMHTRYNNRGCEWWTNRVDLWTDQLANMNQTPNTSQGQYHLDLKNAKIAFAQAMHVQCNCIGPPPALIGSNEGQITLEQYNQKEGVDVETGTLNIDVTSGKLSNKKTITDFILQTTDLTQNGETRSLNIRGDVGANFSLEIINEDNSYYNFDTNLFLFY